MTKHSSFNAPATLADVLDILHANPDHDPKRQRSKLSAISRIANYLHRPPSEVPANIPQLRGLLSSLHPVACGVKPKTLSAAKSDLASALRTAGILHDRVPQQEPAPAWEEYLSEVPSKHQIWGVLRFARYCSSNGIDPASVNVAVVRAFRAGLENTLLTGDPDKHVKAMVETWNHVIRTHGFNLPTLERPLSHRYRARPLTEYPDSLQTEIKAYVGRLAHRDLFDENGPDKPLRETSLRNIQAYLRQVLDALVSSGRMPNEFTCLEDVVSADNLKVAFRIIMKRRGSNDFPSGFGNIAATFIAIARYYLDVPEDGIEALKVVHKRVSKTPRGMSPKNAERLVQFNDWRNVAFLLSLPETLMTRANDNPVSRDSALAAMHSAAMTILLSCPMRVKNLAGLDLDKHIIRSQTGTHTIYSIRIEGTEVKNGEPIEVRLNSANSKLLHRYIMQFRPFISEAESRALFPRKCDGKPRAPHNLGNELTFRVKRETGLEVNPHLFRHIAAKLYLDERPGDFETVRRLLKHKRLQTTMDFYAELANQWAHDHYDKVVLNKWKGQRND